MNGSTRQQRDPGVVIGGDGALLHRHSQRETTNVGRQKWVTERTRYRGRALRAGRSLWSGARQVVGLEGMTG